MIREKEPQRQPVLIEDAIDNECNELGRSHAVEGRFAARHSIALRQLLRRVTQQLRQDCAFASARLAESNDCLRIALQQMQLLANQPGPTLLVIPRTRDVKQAQR